MMPKQSEKQSEISGIITCQMKNEKKSERVKASITLQPPQPDSKNKIRSPMKKLSLVFAVISSAAIAAEAVVPAKPVAPAPAKATVIALPAKKVAPIVKKLPAKVVTPAQAKK